MPTTLRQHAPGRWLVVVLLPWWVSACAGSPPAEPWQPHYRIETAVDDQPMRDADHVEVDLTQATAGAAKPEAEPVAEGGEAPSAPSGTAAATGEPSSAASAAAQQPVAKAQTPAAEPAAAQTPAAEPAAAPQTPEPQGVSPDVAAELRSRFGSGILLRPDGRVTKEFFLSGEASDVVMSLMREPGQAKPPEPNHTHTIGVDSRSILARMLRGHEIEILLLDKFETVEGVDIRADVNSTAAETTPSKVPHGLLLVTATPDGLAAFEAALNLFFSNIPQIEIEVKVVEYSTDESLGSGVDVLRDSQGVPISPTLDNTNSEQLVQNIVSSFPLNPPITGAGSGSERGILVLGGNHENWDLAARLEVLEARGVADILSSPKLVVRNGGLASVRTTTDLPYPQAKISQSGQNITANIVFKPVGVLLNIRPVIAGTETVILQIYASVSAVTSFASTSPVPTPIISSRDVTTSVHVTDGKTTVISGLVSRSTFDNESKFPILGDIPIIGYLFRSKVETVQRRTLEFHITPRIIQGPRGFSESPVGG